MSVIRDVLDEYDKEVEVVYWRDISDSGTITHQILTAIRDCQYGICYLSEPVEDDSKYAYKDNANVLIEAGMLSIMFRENDFDNWIPIRERDSDKLPSDFANNRTLLVNRLANNSLNDEKLRTDLRSALSSWSEFVTTSKK